jgi:hypothetical protein
LSSVLPSGMTVAAFSGFKGIPMNPSKPRSMAGRSGVSKPYGLNPAGFPQNPKPRPNSARDQVFLVWRVTKQPGP